MAAPSPKLTQAEFHTTHAQMRQILLEGPQRSIFLRQPFGTDPTNTKMEWFCINAVTFMVPFEKFCQVPQAVYEQAVGAGMVPPQSESDVAYLRGIDQVVSDHIIVNGTSIAAQRNMA